MGSLESIQQTVVKEISKLKKKVEGAVILPSRKLGVYTCRAKSPLIPCLVYTIVLYIASYDSDKFGA